MTAPLIDLPRMRTPLGAAVTAVLVRLSDDQLRAAAAAAPVTRPRGGRCTDPVFLDLVASGSWDRRADEDVDALTAALLPGLLSRVPLRLRRRARRAVRGLVLALRTEGLVAPGLAERRADWLAPWAGGQPALRLVR